MTLKNMFVFAIFAIFTSNKITASDNSYKDLLRLGKISTSDLPFFKTILECAQEEKTLNDNIQKTQNKIGKVFRRIQKILPRTRQAIRQSQRTLPSPFQEVNPCPPTYIQADHERIEYNLAQFSRLRKSFLIAQATANTPKTLKDLQEIQQKSLHLLRDARHHLMFFTAPDSD